MGNATAIYVILAKTCENQFLDQVTALMQNMSLIL